MYKKYFILIILPIFFFGCIKKIQLDSDSVVIDEKYDSEYPRFSSSNQLNHITTTVRLLSTIAFYECYEFSFASQIKNEDLNLETSKEKSKNSYYMNQPASGTGTIVYLQGRRVAILTCAHIVDFPDSIVSYFKTKDGIKTEVISSVAYKTDQNISMIDMEDGKNFRVLAMDKEMDIAVIGKMYAVRPTFRVPVFNIKSGSAIELEWGNFVYIIGYPRGQKMVTTGIVSDPNRDKNHSFVLDAVFNRGFSGGIVLAVRDGVPNFEMVGIVRAVSADTKRYLAPEKPDEISELEMELPYQGNIVIEKHENIYYGITFAVSMESIQQFLRDNEQKLNQESYYLDFFFVEDY